MGIFIILLMDKLNGNTESKSQDLNCSKLKVQLNFVGSPGGDVEGENLAERRC